MGSNTQTLTVALTAFALGVAFFTAVQNPTPESKEFIAGIQAWTTWKAKHNKQYPSASEETFRMQVFLKNFIKIQKHNAKKDAGYTMALNNFADLTPEEFQASFTSAPYLQAALAAPRYAPMMLMSSDLPKSVDWRQKGAVNTPKHQGGCGSCYSFASAGAIEALYSIKKGELPELSIQQSLDCSSAFGNNGCSGGYMTQVFDYLIAEGGLVSAKLYPYKMVAGQCQLKSSLKEAKKWKISGYINVPKNDNDALKQAVSMQPVTIGIDARQLNLYGGGVFGKEGQCTQHLTHAVLIVGYGTSEQDGDYWIIKNSWGPSWGENGFFKIKRTDGQKEGPCGVPSLASYPTLHD